METNALASGIVITFEGIDGSGKSSIVRRLYCRLSDEDFRCCLVRASTAVSAPVVEPTGTKSYVESSLSTLAPLVWPGDSAEQHHEPGYGYWTGLVAAYFNGLEQGLLPRLRAEYDLVIIENWCYKFAAKIALKGEGTERLRGLLPLEPSLDAVCFIDTPPDMAWERGHDAGFSYVELGGQDGYEVLGRESFIAYQSRVREQLLSFGGEDWYRIENTGSLDDACDRVRAVLRPLLRQRVGR